MWKKKVRNIDICARESWKKRQMTKRKEGKNMEQMMLCKKEKWRVKIELTSQCKTGTSWLPLYTCNFLLCLFLFAQKGFWKRKRSDSWFWTAYPFETYAFALSISAFLSTDCPFFLTSREGKLGPHSSLYFRPLKQAQEMLSSHIFPFILFFFQVCFSLEEGHNFAEPLRQSTRLVY